MDAVCIITSADKLLWIRQIMAALVGSRVLSDELHFDTLSVLLHDFTLSELLLFASIVIYHSHQYTSYPYSLVLFVSLPFACPQCGRLCVTAIPNATLSPSPCISFEYSLIPILALAIQTSKGLDQTVEKHL